MVNTVKKITSIICLVLFSIVLLSSKVFFIGDTSGSVSMLYDLDATSNFFTQTLDTREVEILDERENLLVTGYSKICENEEVILYFKSQTCGIAIYDKHSGYIWYSTYNNKPKYTFTAAVQAKIESGIIIEYYDIDSKGAIKSAEVCYSQKEKKVTAGSSTIEKLENGFNLDVKFESYGISFKVEVRLEGSKLKVNVPYESIVEEDIVGKLTTKSYKLKSIILFPYLGSENYLINGYAFIPDGSGALIRYNENKTSTAYIKKLYGDDYSFTDYSGQSYIKDNGVLGLPIYGINHGYNQAAFLCEATGGVGSMELHSYPYNYSLIPVNTTYFKYYVRDTFTVSLSQQLMYLLNEEPYPSDFSMTYSFLNGSNANYIGMANTYRESLGLNKETKSASDIPLRIEFLGLDYKPGLFGKNYVTMTKYIDALNIIKDLEECGLGNFNITYLGWNRGGYFTSSATKARTALLLGGKSKLLKLSRYINSKNYSIDYTVNPYVSSTVGFGNKTVKKIGLTPFEVTLESSLDQKGYYVLPSELSKIITSKDKRYINLSIDSLKIDNLNVAYSYRYSSNAVYRTDMINEVVKALDELTKYRISTEKPNSYLFKYLTNYYNAYYESNKYIYETDSVPFMSILLGGYINQYMPNINYISDYELAVLRMIEYNIYPSFLLTKEEAYDLRYTNFEYLNSTEYALWKDLIVSIYSKTNDALKHVTGAKISDHVYPVTGVSKTTYSNGVIIYVNYNKNDVTIDGVSLTPYSYYVKGGN